MIDKKTKICLLAMLISLFVLLIVFGETDGLLGDKEFSEYTRDDLSIAIVPLSIMAVSALSTLCFALVLIVPIIRMYPALIDYVGKRKFSEIDSDIEFLVFDHNELKRACCRTETQNGLWFSVKEYDLKCRKWVVLEEGIHINNADDLISMLQEDYKYDKIKIYYYRNQEKN